MWNFRCKIVFIILDTRCIYTPSNLSTCWAGMNHKVYVQFCVNHIGLSYTYFLRQEELTHKLSNCQ